MLRAIFLALVIFPLAVPASAQRDLSKYDKLGPLVSSKGPYVKDIEDKVQHFVWQHWKQHRPGYIVFTVHTLEGEPTTSHLFIEPARDGTWHIRGALYHVQSDRLFDNDPQKKPDKQVTTRFDAVSAEWVSDRGRYIVLKDRSGKVVDSL